LRPADIETTALGAAYAAGLAVGVWTEETIFASSEAKSSITIFYPQTSEEERENRYKSWSLAVERSFGLANLA
jgi:glycerol kinase